MTLTMNEIEQTIEQYRTLRERVYQVFHIYDSYFGCMGRRSWIKDFEIVGDNIEIEYGSHVDDSDFAEFPIECLTMTDEQASEKFKDMYEHHVENEARKAAESIQRQKDYKEQQERKQLQELLAKYGDVK